MSKSRIAAALFRLKKTGESLIEMTGRLYSADELLSMYLGMPVSEDQGQMFIKK